VLQAHCVFGSGLVSLIIRCMQQFNQQEWRR